VLGCAVNGPGEAKEADIGIAGGAGEGLLFRKGKVVRKVKESQIVDALIEELAAMEAERAAAAANDAVPEPPAAPAPAGGRSPVAGRPAR